VRVSVLLLLGLATVWCLIVGRPTLGQFLIGTAFGAAFVAATGAGRGRTVPASELPRRAGYFFLYLLVLLPGDVVRSNLRMAGRLLRRTPQLRPGIVRVRLAREISGVTVGLEEHAITLSPGQMLVDYSADESVAYVHCIDIADAPRLAGDGPLALRKVLEKIFT
jgi:multicomponent Na+:H+ antiporter subunit E